MTVDELALRERYQVWFIVNVPNKPFLAEVRDLADAFVVLRSIARQVLFIPEDMIATSVGGVNVWDHEDCEWLTWYDEDTGMDFEELESRACELMEKENVVQKDMYHYPVVKQYFDRVLNGEEA